MNLNPFWKGLLIRTILTVSLPILLDDGYLLQGVKYTDIDYLVFTDAASYIQRNQSPFRRHTYRYTPFLAWILSWSSDNTIHLPQGINTPLYIYQTLKYLCWDWWRQKKYFGKLLFCIGDSICGWIIYVIRRQNRIKNEMIGTSTTGIHNEKTQTKEDDTTNGAPSSKQYSLWNYVDVDALWWLYNPLPINICTRGSAESFVVLLPVLLTLIISQKCENLNLRQSYRWILSIMAGMMHGLAVHAKLYPIIYTLSFMTYLAYCDEGQKWKNTLQPNDKIKKNSIQKSTLSSCYPFPWLQPKRLMHLIQLWIYRLLNPSSLLFLLSFSSTFGIFTYLAIVQYGKEALEEGLLYHFSRVDHRHNYSMFWYWIYLARARLTEYPSSSSSLAVMGKALLLPQIVLLLYSSLGIAPYDLSFALFIQTFLFVTQNKVITAQYFTWYLCLLPLCSNRINWHNKSLIRSCVVLGISIGVWLGMAFMLEMKGMSVHLLVWLASISFFIANVNLLGMILSNYKGFDGGNDEIKDIQRSTKTKQQ